MVQDHLMTKIEPSNPLEKYAVSTKKYDLIVGNLPFGKNIKFSNTFFYFLQSDRYAMWEVAIAEKAGIFDEDGVLVLQMMCIKHHWKESIGWNTETGDL